MTFLNKRLWFSKTGSACYISHLDLTRCMGRALKLSRLPVWYTEGFNPHIYMTFGMPLSLGQVGLRECMDFRLTEDRPAGEILQRLGERLPKDIPLLQAADPVRGYEEIRWGDYEILLSGEAVPVLREAVEGLLSADRLLVTKHSKKGDKEVDILPDFKGMAMENREEGLLLSLKLPCSVNGSVNPSLFLEVLRRERGLQPRAVITRKALLCEDFSEIR